VARFNVARSNPFLPWEEGRDITISSSVTSDWNSTVGSQYDYHTQISLNGVVVANHDVTTTASPGFTFVYTLPNPGQLEVRVTVSDRDPTGAASAPAVLNATANQHVFAVQVTDVPITVQGFSAAPTDAAEGQEFTAAVVASAASNDVLSYEWILAQHDPAGGFFAPEQQFFGASQVNLAPRNDGLYVWQVRVRDGDGNVVVRNRQNIPVANLAPNPTVAGVPTEPVDVGTTVTLLAHDNDPGVDDTHTYIWTVDGVTQMESGTSLDIYLSTAGTYTYSVIAVDDAGLASAEVVGSFEAVGELDTANIAYTGQLHFTTSSSTDDTAEVMLRATVTDPDGGDITRATVTFFNTQTLEVYSSGVPVIASATGSDTGFAATSFIHTLAADPELLHVGVRVDGGGTYAAATAGAITTLSKPGAGKIIGSGSMFATSSAGMFGADANSSILFGANARLTDEGIKGGLEMTFQRTVNGEQKMYLISSTAVTSLATRTEGGVGYASIIATVDIYDITDRKKKDYELLQSGLSLEMTLTDGGNKGAGDGIAFTVWNGSNGLVFASNWNGSSATQDLLATGDIKVNGI
jgi:hypothetical protein